MYLAFFLSMPGCPSWNGRWSGEGRTYVIIKQFKTKKSMIKAAKILSEGYYHYSFGDGWAAGITVKEVSGSEVRKLRKASVGFAGYDWMVDSIIDYGEIMNSAQVKAHLAAQEVTSGNNS